MRDVLGRGVHININVVDVVVVAMYSRPSAATPLRAHGEAFAMRDHVVAKLEGVRSSLQQRAWFADYGNEDVQITDEI